MTDINKIRNGINTYFKLKFFIWYVTFAGLIMFVMKQYNTAIALLVVGLLYMIMLNNYKEEFIDGKNKE